MSTPRFGINIIVAACSNNGIGINGALPWRLKRDMEFFKAITTATDDPNKQNAMIMGRKTFFSIPAKYRPLKDRVNIVLSREAATEDGYHIARSFTDALDLVNSQEMCKIIENVFVIGGASVYQTALDECSDCRIYYTDIQADIKCDTFFPKIDSKKFRELDQSEFPALVPRDKQTENDICYSFKVFDKKI